MKLKIKGIEIELEQLPNGKFKKPDLVKKYEGFRYSIAPLKQTCETVMVFQKPYLTKSCLHDTLALEAGDKTVACGALAISQNKVGVSGGGTHCDNRDENGKCRGHNNAGQRTSGETVHADETNGGRYPSQTFVDSGAAARLDEQSGIKKSTLDKSVHAGIDGTSTFAGDKQVERIQRGDIGGCSKILHKCDFEDGEYDLYLYAPKVSGKERNAGLDEMGERKGGSYHFRENGSLDGNETLPSKNPHPTLKPISLNEKILRLFKTPNPQRICYPFAGSGSEIIGGHKAGFTDWLACELNPEYVEIAKARLKHWTGAEPEVKTLEIRPEPEVRTETPQERKARLIEEELNGRKLTAEEVRFVNAPTS
jgi:hypothetical protein